MRGRFEVARQILVRAHGEQSAARELAEVRASLGAGTRGSAAKLRELWAPELRRVLSIGLVVGVLQQITGINSVLAYATMIFERVSAGTAGLESSFVQTALVTLVNVVFTVVALLLIDRVGRRPLMIFGTAGIAISLFVAAWGFQESNGGLHAWTILAGLLGFVACFAVSLGPVMWVLLSEIFPNEYRGVAISVAGFWNALVSASVTFVFPWELSTLGSAGTFLVYGLFASAALLFVLLFVPETKGRTLEELEGELLSRPKATTA
jgi:SP family arabinose:H+ symporter-like MFS transporter